MLKLEFEKNINTSSGKSTLSITSEIDSGKIVGIFGNSGEGKSTIFNSICGLIEPDRGHVSFKDQVWFNKESGTFVKPQKRKIGYLLQEDSLFPHFTVEQNVLFPLDKEERKKVNIHEILEQVGMEKFSKTLPKKLSGGQKQRIALARALAMKSELLLLDEPFSALDLEIKHKLYKLIRSLNEELKMTILLVSHDVHDIFALCSDVLWLKNHECKSKINVGQFKTEIEKYRY